MEDRIAALETQIQDVARTNRRLRWALGLALFLPTLALCFGFVRQDTIHDVLKTRHLLVVDEQGASRVIIGAPVDDKKYMNFSRNKPMFGIALCDAKANEQIGIGVSDDGSAAMGLDAKVGVGNPANRERINFAVNSDGAAMIRILDNETLLKTVWSTNKDGKSSLMLLKRDSKDGKPTPVGAMVYGAESKFQVPAELFGGV